MSFRRYLLLLVCLTPIYLALAAMLPAADDELYYWCWSERLQWSYYDHPPMTAYMIRASTTLFGSSLFAIRLPAVVATLTVLTVIGWLTRPRDLLPLALFTPLFTFGAVLVTPDTPLLMFWALYLAWLVAVQDRLATSQVSMKLWLLGGVILGCGILGKYTTALGAMAGFFSFAFAGNWRRWIAGYALHGLTAFVVALPILIHNIRYDFAPLKFQWEHSMSSPQPGLSSLLEFAGVQFVIFGAQPFAILVWGVWHWRELLAEPRLRVCACLFGLPFAFFLFKATRGPLEGNWAIASYIALVPLAGHWYATARHSAFWRGTVLAAYLAPAVCVVLLTIHLVSPLSVLTPQEDRITRQTGKEALACDLAATLENVGAAGEPVYVPTYQWTAWLRFHQVDARQIDGLTRPSHFTQIPERPSGRDRVLVFSESGLPPELAEGYGMPRPLGHFPLMVRGERVGAYWLLEYSRSGGPSGLADAGARPSRLDQQWLPKSP